MQRNTKIAAALSLLLLLSIGPSRTQAAGCEDMIAQHMVGEALLVAHFVAAAEKSGMQPNEINGTLKNIADQSAIQEIWITDSSGHAYLTNRAVDFTFSPDPAKQPQASAFWPLLTGEKHIVVQEARKREIDDRVFKYVGVAGIDKPRIVQIGIGAEHLCK
jgi:hypothetical protein